MYDDEEYYNESDYNPNEPLMTLIVIIGGFILMITLLYFKFKQ